MGFIKYSVVEIGIEESVPGWIKKSQAAEGVVATSDDKVTEPANIKTEG